MRGALANGEVLRSARVARGLTQEQLAVLAGVDAKTLSGPFGRNDTAQAESLKVCRHIDELTAWLLAGRPSRDRLVNATGTSPDATVVGESPCTVEVGILKEVVHYGPCV
jgi:hypothetical protein